MIILLLNKSDYGNEIDIIYFYFLKIRQLHDYISQFQSFDLSDCIENNEQLAYDQPA